VPFNDRGRVWRVRGAWAVHAAGAAVCCEVIQSEASIM